MRPVIDSVIWNSDKIYFLSVTFPLGERMIYELYIFYFLGKCYPNFVLIQFYERVIMMGRFIESTEKLSVIIINDYNFNLQNYLHQGCDLTISTLHQSLIQLKILV